MNSWTLTGNIKIQCACLSYSQYHKTYHNAEKLRFITSEKGIHLYMCLCFSRKFNCPAFSMYMLWIAINSYNLCFLVPKKLSSSLVTDERRKNRVVLIQDVSNSTQNTFSRKTDVCTLYISISFYKTYTHLFPTHIYDYDLCFINLLMFNMRKQCNDVSIEVKFYCVILQNNFKPNPSEKSL